MGREVSARGLWGFGKSCGPGLADLGGSGWRDESRSKKDHPGVGGDGGKVIFREGKTQRLSVGDVSFTAAKKYSETPG